MRHVCFSDFYYIMIQQFLNFVKTNKHKLQTFKTNISRFSGSFHVNQSLIQTSSEQQVERPLADLEPPIHKHIHMVKQSLIVNHAIPNLLIGEPRIAPYGQALVMRCGSKLSTRLGLQKRFAADSVMPSSRGLPIIAMISAVS